MHYNDCGITHTRGNNGIISYKNALRTKLDNDQIVYPVIPLFDISLQCDQYTDVKFILDGDFAPTLTSIKLNFEVSATITGNLTIYEDEQFTTELEGIGPFAHKLDLKIIQLLADIKRRCLKSQ